MTEQNHEHDVLKQPSAAEQQRKEDQQKKLDEAKQRGEKTDEKK